MGIKNKNNNIDDYLKLSIIGGMAIVALSIAYYFVIFIPQKESQKVELQKEELRINQEKEEKNTSALKTCLYQAELSASNYWNKSCKNFGINKREDDCTLPQYNADAVSASKKNDQEQCYKLYR